MLRAYLVTAFPCSSTQRFAVTGLVTAKCEQVVLLFYHRHRICFGAERFHAIPRHREEETFFTSLMVSRSRVNADTRMKETLPHADRYARHKRTPSSEYRQYRRSHLKV